LNFFQFLFSQVIKKDFIDLIDEPKSFIDLVEEEAPSSSSQNQINDIDLQEEQLYLPDFERIHSKAPIVHYFLIFLFIFFRN